MTPAEQLTNSLRGTWHRTYGTGCCPAHDDQNHSLSVRDGERDILVTCFVGCGRVAIIEACRRMGIWPEDDRRERRPIRRTDEDERKRACALRYWGEAVRLRNPHPYFIGRGITAVPPPSLREHRGLKHKPTGLVFPTIICAVQGPDRNVIAIQRIFLTADRTRKAQVEKAKMALASLRNGAVRLAPAEIELGLAEGVETALSVMRLSGIPCWASLGGERLAKLALPPNVARVIIFADNGGACYAEQARSAYLAQGRAVEIQFPPDGFKDFNDVLTGRRAA